MVRELSFNRTMRDKLKHYGFKIDRVESHATTPGIPDDAFVHKATRHSGWIEVKETVAMPMRIKYRPKQPLWLTSHVLAGGNAMTIVHVTSTKKVIIIPGALSIAAERDLRTLIHRRQVFIINDDEWSIIADTILSQCHLEFP